MPYTGVLEVLRHLDVHYDGDERRLRHADPVWKNMKEILACRLVRVAPALGRAENTQVRLAAETEVSVMFQVCVGERVLYTFDYIKRARYLICMSKRLRSLPPLESQRRFRRDSSARVGSASFSLLLGHGGAVEDRLGGGHVHDGHAEAA